MRKLFEKLGDYLKCYRKPKIKQKVFVNVDLISLDWIVEKDHVYGKKLIKLITILESIKDEELYATPFIDSLKKATMRLRN